MAIMELRDELCCRIVLRRQEIAAIYIDAPFRASFGRGTPLEGEEVIVCIINGGRKVRTGSEDHKKKY